MIDSAMVAQFRQREFALTAVLSGHSQGGWLASAAAKPKSTRPVEQRIGENKVFTPVAIKEKNAPETPSCADSTGDWSRQILLKTRLT
jgi:hypothetical protein